MKTRPTHVRIDEQHARSAQRERQRQIRGRRRLALERLAAGHADDPRSAPRRS